MVTAADGAEEFYDLDTNEARYESKDEAIRKDMRLRAAYKGHPKWIMVGNTKGESFQRKIEKVKEHIHAALGSGTGVTFYRKFLIQKEENQKKDYLSIVPIDFSKLGDVEDIQIREHFLLPTGGNEVIESSVERRGIQERYIYTYKYQYIKKG